MGRGSCCRQAYRSRNHARIQEHERRALRAGGARTRVLQIDEPAIPYTRDGICEKLDAVQGELLCILYSARPH